MMRVGRMRSASLTRARRVISPVPSRFASRVCIATTSRSARFSSKISSMVMTRSRDPMEEDSALSMVVLPAWVGPVTMTFNPAVIAQPR